jgi:hypothetical protein
MMESEEDKNSLDVDLPIIPIARKFPIGKGRF